MAVSVIENSVSGRHTAEEASEVGIDLYQSYPTPNSDSDLSGIDDGESNEAYTSDLLDIWDYETDIEQGDEAARYPLSPMYETPEPDFFISQEVADLALKQETPAANSEISPRTITLKPTDPTKSKDCLEKDFEYLSAPQNVELVPQLAQSINPQSLLADSFHLPILSRSATVSELVCNKDELVSSWPHSVCDTGDSSFYQYSDDADQQDSPGRPCSQSTAENTYFRYCDLSDSRLEPRLAIKWKLFEMADELHFLAARLFTMPLRIDDDVFFHLFNTLELGRKVSTSMDCNFFFY